MRWRCEGGKGATKFITVHNHMGRSGLTNAGVCSLGCPSGQSPHRDHTASVSQIHTVRISGTTFVGGFPC